MNIVVDAMSLFLESLIVSQSPNVTMAICQTTSSNKHTTI